MILIVSSNDRERAAFTLLCESSGWPYAECDSFQRVLRTLRHVQPSVVLTRHRLRDGYSDDVVRLLGEHGVAEARVIVLIPAAAPAVLEARQIQLGADVVYRDPLRADVIKAYLDRFRQRQRPTSPARPASNTSFEFAGVRVNVLARSLERGRRVVRISPREVALLQILFDARGQVVSYEMLYAEILGRPFRGETSNLRVLLGKVRGSLRAAGLTGHPGIEVLPKTGYRYRPAPASESSSATRVAPALPAGRRRPA